LGPNILNEVLLDVMCMGFGPDLGCFEMVAHVVVAVIHPLVDGWFCHHVHVDVLWEGILLDVVRDLLVMPPILRPSAEVWLVVKLILVYD